MSSKLFKARRRTCTAVLLILAAAIVSASAPSAVSLAESASNPCAAIAFEGYSFTACTADPNRDEIKLFLTRSEDGTLYGSLAALPTDRLLFATNAGMFTPQYAPAGLYVEGGRQLKPLNTRSGGGNFHLAPNGVFWMKNGKAHVSTTASYKMLAPAPDLATQSGPMLVIGGVLHPKFDADGPSRYIRNGIGVTGAGAVVVAISEEPVSFGVFARLFRDKLGCPDALYLDGSVSRLLVTGDRRLIGGPQLGPLIGVYATR